MEGQLTNGGKCPEEILLQRFVLSRYSIEPCKEYLSQICRPNYWFYSPKLLCRL